MTKIGIHLPTNSNVLRTLADYENQGGQAAQVFCGNPRSFFSSKFPERYTGNLEIVTHATFVVNLAAPHDRAIPGFRTQVEWAASIGSKWIVVHAGSSKDTTHEQGRRSIHKMLREVDDLPVRVLLENMASRIPWGGVSAKGSMGALETLIRVAEGLDPERFGICLDIAHAWAGGENIEALKKLKSNPWMPVIHANVADASVRRGSSRDRHSSTEGGAYPFSMVAEIVASIQPEVAIIESRDVTVETANYLSEMVGSCR